MVLLLQLRSCAPFLAGVPVIPMHRDPATYRTPLDFPFLLCSPNGSPDPPSGHSPRTPRKVCLPRPVISFLISLEPSFLAFPPYVRSSRGPHSFSFLPPLSLPQVLFFVIGVVFVFSHRVNSFVFKSSFRDSSFFVLFPPPGNFVFLSEFFSLQFFPTLFLVSYLSFPIVSTSFSPPTSFHTLPPFFGALELSHHVFVERILLCPPLFYLDPTFPFTFFKIHLYWSKFQECSRCCGGLGPFPPPLSHSLVICPLPILASANVASNLVSSIYQP